MFRFSILSALPATALAIMMLAVFPLRAQASPGKDKTPPAVLRWAEGQPGCTFSRDDDGKYRYALWTGEYGVILAVDSQELEKVHRRVEPFFSVQLTVRYRGKGTLAVSPGRATLEFVKHFKVTQSSLDPEGFALKAQNDADELEHQTAREIEKHPERKQEREQYVEAYQKDMIGFLEFLTKRTLREAQLDASHSEASGWVLFTTKSKWIGEWKKPEEFVLRIPLGDRVVEFPFAQPAQQEDLIMRKRP